MNLDNNIILIPVSMLMMNLTGPLIQKRLPRAIYEFIELPIFEPFTYMFLFYVAIRRFWVALIMGLVFYVLTTTIFNEKSQFYILPKRKEEPISLENSIPDRKGELAVGKPALARRNAMMNHYQQKKEKLHQYSILMNSIQDTYNNKSNTNTSFLLNSFVY